MSVVLLDIEGTTTSISFVADELFPFARERLEAFVRTSWGSEAMAADIAALRALAAQDRAAGRRAPALTSGDVAGAAIAYLLQQMDEDRKTTPLKSIQGRIWRSGYESGLLRGHVFDEVPGALARWRAAGTRVCIYSSGSVDAQQLLFAHSVHGDLTPDIAEYFDTTTGPKRDSASYTKIARRLGVVPSAVWFCTDLVAEAEAAVAAGMRAAVADRPGNPVTAPHALPVVRDLDALSTLVAPTRPGGPGER